MALLWIDSFDDRTSLHGAKYDASVGSAGMVAVNPGKNGKGLSLVASTAQSLTKTFSARQTYLVGLHMRINNATPTTIPFLEILDGATVQCKLQATSGNLVQVVRGDGTVLATSVNALSSSLWVFLEFRLKIADSGGIAQVRLNEVTDISVSGDTKHSANATATSVRLFCETGTTNYIEIDDLYIADDQGSQNNDFLSTIAIECKRPNAIGSSSGWTPWVVGSNYLQVDDPDRDDDTTYVAATVVGTKDLYGVENLTSPSGSIKGAMLGLWARKDDALTRKIIPIVKSGSTEYDASEITLTSSYVFSSQLYETDPDTASPWTSGGINGVEIGAKISV